MFDLNGCDVIPSKNEKVPANAQEVELQTHSSSGIKGGKMQEFERRNVRYLRNVISDSGWE